MSDFGSMLSDAEQYNIHTCSFNGYPVGTYRDRCSAKQDRQHSRQNTCANADRCFMKTQQSQTSDKYPSEIQKDIDSRTDDRSAGSPEPQDPAPLAFIDRSFLHSLPSFPLIFCFIIYNSIAKVRICQLSARLQNDTNALQNVSPV